MFTENKIVSEWHWIEQEKKTLELSIAQKYQLDTEKADLDERRRLERKIRSEVRAALGDYIKSNVPKRRRWIFLLSILIR